MLKRIFFFKLRVENWRQYQCIILHRRQLNWYFSLSALIWDNTDMKMTPPVIQICHTQNALFSGWHFFLRGLFVAIIGKVQLNKLFLGDTAIWYNFFFDFFCKRVFQLTLNTLIKPNSPPSSESQNPKFKKNHHIVYSWFHSDSAHPIWAHHYIHLGPFHLGPSIGPFPFGPSIPAHPDWAHPVWAHPVWAHGC